MRLIICEDIAYRDWLCRYVEENEYIQAKDLQTVNMNPIGKIWNPVSRYFIGLTPLQVNDNQIGVHRRVFFRVISTDPLIVAMHKTKVEEEECD